MFWDWKSGRIKSRLRCHSKVVIAHEWLPHETVCSSTSPSVDLAREVLTFAHFVQSKIVTGSWDGLIKLWVGITLYVVRTP